MIRLLPDDLEKMLDLDADRWLAAFFSRIAGGWPPRLFFGMLDLGAGESPLTVHPSKAIMSRLGGNPDGQL